MIPLLPLAEHRRRLQQKSSSTAAAAAQSQKRTTQLQRVSWQGYSVPLDASLYQYSLYDVSHRFA